MSPVMITVAFLAGFFLIFAINYALADVASFQGVDVEKIVGLEGYGLKVVERVPMEIAPHDRNIIYLKTKKKKLGHMLSNV